MFAYSPITYSRPRRAYVATLPNGGEVSGISRPVAEAAYVAHAAPELYGKVQGVSKHYPALAERARKAALLVLAGKVAIRTANPFGLLASVVSSDGQSVYNVYRAPDGQCDCTCADGSPADDAPGAPETHYSAHTCKHILACLLY